MLTTLWDNFFKEHLLPEALIKFEIQDYGTLYKTDIYSYSFKGRSRWLCDEYPSFKAVIKAINRPEYSNYEDFIGKSVVVFYGFIRNGNDDYKEAMKLIIENLTISDDGRIATFELNSSFSKYTNTFKVRLQGIETEANFNTYVYTKFLTDMSNNGLGSYTRHSTGNYSYRTLPSKITVGQALQEMTFLNCACMRLNYSYSMDREQIKIEGDMFDDPINYPINILKHPHFEKIAHSSVVVVDFYSRADLRMEDAQYTYATERLMTTDNSGVSYYPYKKTKTIYFEMPDGVYLSTWFVWHSVAYTPDGMAQATRCSGDVLDTTMYNTQMGINALSDVYGGSVDISISAVSYKNYISYEVDKTSIFHINITSQTQADAIKSRVENYLSSQKNIELQLRINPAFEILDTLFYDDTHKRVYIEELDIDFNGAYKGRVKGVYKDDFLPPVITHLAFDSSKGEWTLKNNNHDFAVKPAYEYEDGTQISSATLLTQISRNGGTKTTNAYYSPALLDIEKIAKKYNQGKLDKDVYVYFKKDNGRSEHILLLNRNYLPTPPQVSYIQVETPWFIDITNPTDEDLTLIVWCSQGNRSYTIQAHQTLTLDENNCQELDDSIYAYRNSDLQDDVYCYFLKDTAYSDNVIILEANA